MSQIFIVTGRSIDGAEYFTTHGWQLDGYQHAALMTREDAEKVAASEESKQAATRNPDCGIYQIAVKQWGGPSLFSFGEYAGQEE